MSVDVTLPLWGIITYLMGAVGVVVGFVIYVRWLGWRLGQAEKDIILLKDKITEVEYDQKNEIKEIHKSLKLMNDNFHELNLNLHILIGSKKMEKSKDK